jgi:hypothetical protein
MGRPDCGHWNEPFSYRELPSVRLSRRGLKLWGNSGDVRCPGSNPPADGSPLLSLASKLRWLASKVPGQGSKVLGDSTKFHGLTRSVAFPLAGLDNAQKPRCTLHCLAWRERTPRSSLSSNRWSSSLRQDGARSPRRPRRALKQARPRPGRTRPSRWLAGLVRRLKAPASPNPRAARDRVPGGLG